MVGMATNVCMYHAVTAITVGKLDLTNPELPIGNCHSSRSRVKHLSLHTIACRTLIRIPDSMLAVSISVSTHPAYGRERNSLSLSGS